MTRPTKIDAEAFNVYYKTDSDFSAFGRLLQSKWRQKKGLPFLKYGNFLEKDSAKLSKANFLTDNIRNLVQSEIKKARLHGGLISEPRIWNNLLSSQPLCFNLFGELSLDLKLATKFFKELFPTKISEVTEIKFEYSPGRGTFHCDHSAFDVFVEYKNHIGANCFIGIEVKYAECLKEESTKKAKETFEKHKDDYFALTTPDIFKANAVDSLQHIPLAQIWRDHLLTLATRKQYTDGFFLFLFPKENKECQKGVDDYIKQLISENEDEIHFSQRYLETFITTLKRLHPTDWTMELEERYIGSY